MAGPDVQVPARGTRVLLVNLLQQLNAFFIALPNELIDRVATHTQQLMDAAAEFPASSNDGFQF